MVNFHQIGRGSAAEATKSCHRLVTHSAGRAPRGTWSRGSTLC